MIFCGVSLTGFRAVFVIRTAGNRAGMVTAFCAGSKTCHSNNLPHGDRGWGNVPVWFDARARLPGCFFGMFFVEDGQTPRQRGIAGAAYNWSDRKRRWCYDPPHARAQVIGLNSG